MARKKRQVDRASDLATLIGASNQTSVQVLTLYVPAKDMNGRALRNQRRWVMDAAQLLAKMGGGVTIMPPVRGGWLSPSGKIVWEDTVLVYSYIKPASFIEHLFDLRNFLHRLGRETRQGEVVLEFDGSMYRITEFDAE